MTNKNKKEQLKQRKQRKLNELKTAKELSKQDSGEAQGSSRQSPINKIISTSTLITDGQNQ